MGHVGMEKKNPYVMTIGFDKNDPEHVEVAGFLNSLPRKKAQYIVEAVRCYRQVQRGGSSWGEENTDKPLDKEELRQIVLQILAERGDDKEQVAQKSISQPAIHERTKPRTDMQDTNTDIETNADTASDAWPDTAADMIAGLDKRELEVIFGSLEALRR